MKLHRYELFYSILSLNLPGYETNIKSLLLHRFRFCLVCFCEFSKRKKWVLAKEFVDTSLSGTQINNTRTGWSHLSLITERRCVQCVTNLLIRQIWVKVLLNRTWRVENMFEVLHSIIKQQCASLKSFFQTCWNK